MTKVKERAEIQLQEVSAFVHAVLASFHILGVMYNFRRRNHWDVLAHSLAAAYDVRAMYNHIQEVDLLKHEAEESK